jgi:hypothetical protein
MSNDEPLQLRDFVAETIKQIIDGVAAAQEYAKDKKAIVNPRTLMHHVPPPQSVSFDVAITAAKGTKTQGGIAVFAGAFGLGSKGQSERSDETLNRIRFSVPVWLPMGEFPGAPASSD